MQIPLKCNTITTSDFLSGVADWVMFSDCGMSKENDRTKERSTAGNLLETGYYSIPHVTQKTNYTRVAKIHFRIRFLMLYLP